MSTVPYGLLEDAEALASRLEREDVDNPYDGTLIQPQDDAHLVREMARAVRDLQRAAAPIDGSRASAKALVASLRAEMCAGGFPPERATDPAGGGDSAGDVSSQ